MSNLLLEIAVKVCQELEIIPKGCVVLFGFLKSSF